MTNLGPTSTFTEFAAELRRFIGKHHGAATSMPADEEEFNRLALWLFSLQVAYNLPYRQFCHTRKVSPQTVRHWSEIPAMPTSGFKELELSSLPPGYRMLEFHSSGTTEQRPSRHFHNAESLGIYEASLVPWFATHFLTPPDAHEEWYWVFLTPAADEARHSSLVYMFETLRRKHSQNSLFAGTIHTDGTWDLDLNAAVAAMRMAIADNSPVMLCGTAFNFVHLLDHLAETGLSLRLPDGSRVLETGGYKGRSRSMPKEELHQLITAKLGVPASHIVCEYGMSELSSQAYDAVAGNAQTGRVFRFPPWARAQIVSPETGREVNKDETGLIRIFDLANVYSVMAIQTEDLGVRRGSGFELLGRAALSESRGCSLMSL